MDTKRADSEKGFLRNEEPVKKIELVFPEQEIYLQFMLHKLVTIRTSPTRLKPGKQEKGTREIVKKYPYKVVIDTGGVHTITVLFANKHFATSFTWQAFFSNTYKFMWKEKEAVIWEAV